jgi:type IV pilus assembly protein PilN
VKPIYLNLATRPFVNDRPIFRAAALLWVAGLVLLVVNVFLYQRHIAGQAEQREALRELEERLAADTAAIDDLRSELSRTDLEQQNEQVMFLNGEIAQRTFSWSSFFDDLAEVLPADIQLQRVSPNTGRGRTSGKSGSSSASSADRAFTVSMSGTAKTGEAVLEFVDALFTHRAFVDPNLSREATQSNQEHVFALSVLYLPKPSTKPAAEQDEMTPPMEEIEAEPEAGAPAVEPAPDEQPNSEIDELDPEYDQEAIARTEAE